MNESFYLCHTMCMNIVVGLGNPTSEYEYTRHNAGRIVLSYIADANDFSVYKEDLKTKTLRSKGEINNTKFEFIFPNNFMNNSGSSLVSLFDTMKKISKLVVVYDDIDLSFGSIKISYNRSSGGHNGLESIIKKLKTREFIRIRIGISPSTPTGKFKKPKGEDAVLKFLLGKFKDEELKILKKESKKVVQMLEMLANEGKDKAMSVYN